MVKERREKGRLDREGSQATKLRENLWGLSGTGQPDDRGAERAWGSPGLEDAQEATVRGGSKKKKKRQVRKGQMGVPENS